MNLSAVFLYLRDHKETRINTTRDVPIGIAYYYIFWIYLLTGFERLGILRHCIELAYYTRTAGRSEPHSIVSIQYLYYICLLCAPIYYAYAVAVRGKQGAVN
jgi:hypothetical protein